MKKRKLEINMHQLCRAIQYRLAPLPKMGIPLSDFYRIWHGEGVPGPHPHAKFHCCGFKHVGPQPPKSPKLTFLV